MKTIKQLADENKVSKTTIRRYMKKINADAVTNENGISLIDDDTANVISDMLKQNKPEQNTETVEHTLNTSAEQLILSKQQQINILMAQVEQLQNQINIKDNQIAELTTALKASQSIQAMYVKRIEEQEAEHEPEQKQNIFSRLFKR